MKSLCHSLLLGSLLALPLQAVTTTYTFEDFDGDETFDVFFEVSGGSNGLSTYNIQLGGLDKSPLDPETFVWQQHRLDTLSGPDYSRVGFNGVLLQSAVGTNGFSAANTQWGNPHAVFGVGQIPIHVSSEADPSGNSDLRLDSRTLLGQLTLPGVNQLADEELVELIWPNAALFNGSDTRDVSRPDSVRVRVGDEVRASGDIGHQERRKPEAEDPPVVENPFPAEVPLTPTVEPIEEVAEPTETVTEELVEIDVDSVSTEETENDPLIVTYPEIPIDVFVECGPMDDFLIQVIDMDGMTTGVWHEENPRLIDFVAVDGVEFFTTNGVLTNLGTSVAFDNVTADSLVPEPTSLALVCFSLVGCAGMRRRRNR